MKRVLLHVGLPKTGTTSIQDLLAAASPDLEADGVLFPVVREDVRAAGRAQKVGLGWHRALWSFAADRLDQLADGEWAAWQAEFRRFADTPSLDTLLLSQEGLIGAGKPQRIAALMEEVPAGARRVVLVLRPADAWLPSLYEQLVRSVVRAAALPGEFPAALTYAERGFEGMVRQIERRLPGAEIQLLSFEALIAGDGLLTNFTRALDLPDWLAERAKAMPRANAGLPQDVVAFLRAANAAKIPTPAFFALRGALARAARRRKGVASRAQIFPDDLARRIAERYEADRVFVRRRFGLELAPRAAPAPQTPFACDPAALRAECAAFLDGPAAAAFDAVARMLA